MLHTERADRFADTVLAAIEQPVLVVTAEGTVTYLGPAAVRALGRDAEAVLGTSVFDHIHPDDHAVVFDGMLYAATRPADPLLPLVARVVLDDGSWRWCEIRTHDLQDDPTVGGFVVMLIDVTERALLNAALESVVGDRPLDETVRLLADQLAELTGNPAVVEWSVDDRGPVSVAGSSALDPDLLPADGASPAGGTGEAATASRDPWREVRGRDVEEVVVDVDELGGPARSTARDAGFRALWVVPVTSAARGEARASVGMWLRAAEPSPGRRQALAQTVSFVRLALERHRMERRLRHAALHDPLTGLVNRAGFFGQLADALAAASAPVAVLYLDLDGFKEVNDRDGHTAGDEVLRVVAQRVSATVRPGDVVARLGGDELAVICAGLGSVGEADAVARRIVATIGEPLSVGGRRISIGVSIGISVASAGGAAAAGADHPDRLVERADRALYEAKAAGGNTWRVAGDR